MDATDVAHADHNDLIRNKLSARLSAHLAGIDLTSFSRIPSERYINKSLPNISTIELVSGPDFASLYEPLYNSNFPLRKEREDPHLIVQRLLDEFANLRSGFAPFRVIGLRNHAGEAIGAAQFSLLFLSGGSYAIPYLQYIYIRPENRRQDMAELLHTMILAVSSADVHAAGGRGVPFTLFETEPADTGDDDAARLIARQRVQIHAFSGGLALMLRVDDGQLLTPHVQPGLEGDDPPVTLMWAIRPSPSFFQRSKVEGDDDTRSRMLARIVEEQGRALLAAYYRSLRDEGFPVNNIALAENIAYSRCEGRRFVTADMEAVPVYVKPKSA